MLGLNKMITIIVPVYKVENYLSRCVDSILNQTYTDFRLILVDDGSPDNCGKMCDEYAQKDNRVTVLHQKNGGLSAARNTGLNLFYEKNESDYILFADSDDWLHPQHLEILMRPVIEKGVKISVCGYERTDAWDGEEYPLYEKSDYELTTPENLLVNHFWNYNYAWGKLLHKSVFEDIRYPVGKNFEDTFTTYKVLYKCQEIAFTPTPLYYYYRNETGISRSPWKESELVIFDAMREQMDFYKNNGYIKAYEKEHELFVHHHAYQIVRIKENKKDLKKNKKVLKEIRTDLKRYLKEHKDKYTVHNMTYSYEAAYPVFMSLYRFASLLKAKLLRK